jgi:transposase
LASDGPPKSERTPAGSSVDVFEPRIRELLRAFPMMPATVIGERIGWSRSIRTLSGRVAELRPAYLLPDPSGRTSYEPGEIAQCDLWFPPINLPVGFGQARKPTQLPVLTMVTGYSRWLSGLLIPARASGDLFAGWWQLISALGAVPCTLVWDGEGAIGRWRAGRVELTTECQAFRGTLGAKVIVLRPREPEHKGIIERAHDYLERSFLPGRTFTSPADFNVQLQQWLGVVNTRSRRALTVRTDRSDHRRPGRDARPAAGGASDRMATLVAAAARSLRALGQQRLFGAPGRDRPPHRGGRRPGSGHGVLRGSAGR